MSALLPTDNFIAGFSICFYRKVNNLFFYLLVVSVSSFAADKGSMHTARVQQAKRFSIYDFEPRPEHLLSRDSDHDNFPDFWRRLTGPKYPAYEKIGIVRDKWRRSYNFKSSGHVLMMTFSGKDVGVETIYPKVVDADLAYEITVFAKTSGLDKSKVTIDIIWLHMDEKGREEVLGEPDHLVVPSGQLDWSEGPLRRRVNDLHPRTNRVRIVCKVTDQPNIPGADRHGIAWFDDIRIRSRPKISIDSVFKYKDQPLKISINYKGLIPNIPVPGNPEKMKGKKYWRRLEILDVHGNHPDINSEGTRHLEPGNSTTIREKIIPRISKLGVFYLHVILYGANNQPQASVTQVFGRWLPPRLHPGLKRNAKIVDEFGIGFDALASINKAGDDAVETAFRHLGVFRTKVELWPPELNTQEAEKSTWRIPELLRRLRTVGLRFTGRIGRMPPELIPLEGMLASMRDRQRVLRRLIRKPLTEFGTQMDDWQWGSDNDTSFGHKTNIDIIKPSRKMLRDLTSAFVQGLSVVLGSAGYVPAFREAEAINVFVPASMDEDTMMVELAKLMPARFTELVRWEREIFPPDYIVKLAQLAASALGGAENALRIEPGVAKQATWLDIEALPVDAHLREVSRERAQAIDLARKVILGKTLGFERIFAGDLIEPERGLAEVTRTGKVIPRPAFLVLRSLSQQLDGASYLGSFLLGVGVENYVFRTRHKTAIMAVWYTGRKRYENISIGQGLGKLKIIDLAGNETKIRDKFRISQMPVLLDGISVPLARTRMSIRVMEDPPLSSSSEIQSQRLTIRNFFSEPLVGTFRLQYAAYIDGKRRIRLEPGWSSPPIIRINLPPGGEDSSKRIEARRQFEVRPTREAVIGKKFVRIETQLTAILETRFNLLRSTELTSRLKMKITPVESTYPSMKVMRLAVIWLPDPNATNPVRLQLLPYYQIAGDQHVYQGIMTVYPATPAQPWKGAAIRDIRIPSQFKGKRIWLGADEDGGSRFLRREATKLMLVKIKE